MEELLEAAGFYFGGGYLDGSEAVAREVVDYDAEKVLAFDGSADLLTVLDAIRDVLLELVEGEAMWRTLLSRLTRTPAGLKTRMTSSKEAWICRRGGGER